MPLGEPPPKIYVPRCDGVFRFIHHRFNLGLDKTSWFRPILVVITLLWTGGIWGPRWEDSVSREDWVSRY